MVIYFTISEHADRQQVAHPADGVDEAKPHRERQDDLREDVLFRQDVLDRHLHPPRLRGRANRRATFST
jgi:hypothetical protein